MGISVFLLLILHNKGHSIKLKASHSKPIKKNVCTQHIISLWNSLPQDIIETMSFFSSEKRLHIYWWEHPQCSSVHIFYLVSVYMYIMKKMFITLFNSHKNVGVLIDHTDVQYIHIYT